MDCRARGFPRSPRPIASNVRWRSEVPRARQVGKSANAPVAAGAFGNQQQRFLINKESTMQRVPQGSVGALFASIEALLVAARSYRFARNARIHAAYHCTGKER